MCYLFIFYVTSVSETGSEGTNGKLPQPSFHFLLLGSWSDYLLMLSKYQSHMIWLLDPLLSRGTCLRRREGWARKCCVSLETHLNHGIPVSFRKCGWRWIHSVRLQLSQPHQEICGLRERYFFFFLISTLSISSTEIGSGKERRDVICWAFITIYWFSESTEDSLNVHEAFSLSNHSVTNH